MSYPPRLSKACGPDKQDPQVVSWEDNRYGIQEMAIDEHYGLGIINEGQAIATAKTVKVRPNEFVLPARSVFNLNESGSALESMDTVANFGALAVLPLVKNAEKTWAAACAGHLATSPKPDRISPSKVRKAFQVSHFPFFVTWHKSIPGRQEADSLANQSQCAPFRLI